jgi:hypothetical protein
MMRRLGTILMLMALGSTSMAGAAESAPPPGCAAGSVAAAARALVHPAAEVRERSTVSGIDSALVLEPLIYPGVRHRLLRAGDLWCDAEGFNAAWLRAGRGSDAVTTASVYAQIAAAPYFDGITVRRAVPAAPGVIVVDTHALTNGVTARWLIHVDGAGVRRAGWTATGFAVRPFVAEMEGPTALPGVRRTYLRGADGRIAALEEIVPAPTADPELVTEGKTADEFTIRIQQANTELSPNAGMDVGVHAVDFVRFVRKVALENYQEFYDWGLRKGWTSDIGLIHVDSTTAATCLACVFIREDFNIHISTAVVQALRALGFEYPDDQQAFSNVIGHEMTHTFQNAYYKPEQNGAFSDVAFAEGIARFQESIHSYSEVSHQPDSLIYSTGREIPFVSLAANSCNGWDGGDISTTFANGPFTSKTYNACYFWLTWYPNHGTGAIVDLFTAMFDHAKAQGPVEVIGALKQATDDTFAQDLAAFASAAITGQGYTWPAPGTEEPARDWGIWLDRWEDRPLLGLEETATRTLRNGGVSSYEITQGGWATLSSSAGGGAVAVVRDDGSAATYWLLDPADPEDEIDAPAEGERVYLVGIYPEVGASAITVGLTSTRPPDPEP